MASASNQSSELEELAAYVRSHPALRAKGAIQLVSEVLSGGSWVHGPGDDGAVVPMLPDNGGDGTADQVIACGEALLPSFVRHDPFGAGIAAVLTNVNANATSLTPAYLEKAAALAAVFRPYGVRVYLTARFSAPIELGGLKTADPLDPAVRAWWKAKVDEIYRYIPDFGGFLVKANSEGQPGPQEYQRNHADGANMLAEALAPHGGVVMWRAFVYSSENTEDRARQWWDLHASDVA